MLAQSKIKTNLSKQSSYNLNIMNILKMSNINISPYKYNSNPVNV